MRLSLSELAALHRLETGKRFGIGFRGEVEAILRNADGGIDQVIKQKNAATQWLNQVWVANLQDRRKMSVFVAADDNHGRMHPLKSIFLTTYPAADVANIYNLRSLDSTNLLWTFQVTFQAPSQDRLIRYIGLASKEALWFNYGNCRMHANVIAATRLTSIINQTTTQTLEVTYRLAFQRV